MIEVAGVAGSITALSAVTGKTKELKDKTDELSNTQKKLEEVNKELKKELEFNEKLAKHNLVADEGSKIHQKGKEQIKTGAVTLAALAVPVKIYMDIEESQADLRKILGEEAEKYYDKLAEISKNNPLSQVEINQIASSLAQSGIKGKDIVAYTENIKTTTMEKVK